MSAGDLPLPGILGELAAAGFAGAALALAAEWGGTRRSIPAHPRPGMPIVALVGMDAALALAKLRGAEEVDIPRAAGLGRVKAAVVRQNGSAREVAKAVGCTERYVRRVRNPDVDPDQGTLF